MEHATKESIRAGHRRRSQTIIEPSLRATRSNPGNLPNGTNTNWPRWPILDCRVGYRLLAMTQKKPRRGERSEAIQTAYLMAYTTTRPAGPTLDCRVGLRPTRNDGSRVTAAHPTPSLRIKRSNPGSLPIGTYNNPLRWPILDCHVG